MAFYCVTKSREPTTNESDMFSALVCTLFVSVNDKLLWILPYQRKTKWYGDFLKRYWHSKQSVRRFRYRIITRQRKRPETVLTNLDRQIYPPQKLKELYAGRWGIETSFRDLKYTLGMLHFHSKKVMCIQQEIYAHLIMYNFSEMITSYAVIKQKHRKHIYKANFSVAVHMCRLFYHRKITSRVLETIISRNVIPVRPGRHKVRKTVINHLKASCIE